MFAVIFSILIVVISISVHLSSRVIMDQAKKASSLSLANISERLDMTFLEIATFSKMAIANSALQEEMKTPRNISDSISYYEKNNAVAHILGTFIKPRTKIESMSILDFVCNEIYFSSEGQSALVDMPVDTIEEIVASLNTENLIYWGEPRPQTSRDGEIWTIPVFMKIYDGYSGTPMGLLESDIPLSLFSSFVVQDVPVAGNLSIIDKTGRILANRDPDMVLEQADSQVLDWCLESIDSPIIHGSSLYEAKYYEEAGWLLSNVVSVDDISRATHPLIFQLLLLGVVALSVTVILSYVLARSITKPLRILGNSMDAFHTPSARQHVPVFGDDEVGHLALVYNEMVDRIVASVERNNAEQKRLRQYEISLLQAQINPHFLNNILENISGLVELGRQEESLSLIRDAASFYRSVLAGGEVMVNLERELEIAKLYLKIQNVRYDNRIDYHVEVDASILRTQIVKLTIQPLLENSLSHGLREKQEPWEIDISGYREGDDVVLQVWDNGRGMSAEMVRTILEKDRASVQGKQEHVGVYATHQRLVLAFGEGYGLKFVSEVSKGTCVFIRLPMEVCDG